MRMHILADIPLSEPNSDLGLITWFSIAVIDDDGKEHKRIGHARVARIHAELALEREEALMDALDADSGDLLAMYERFYDDGWLKESVTEGVHHDVVYVRKIEIDSEYIHRNVHQEKGSSGSLETRGQPGMFIPTENPLDRLRRPNAPEVEFYLAAYGERTITGFPRPGL